MFAKRVYCHLCLGGLICVLLSKNLTAWAQSSPAKLEEVNVYAQKRAEVTQDVPFSLQVFNADILNATGIDGQVGLQERVPSLVVGSQAGFTVTFIRGIGSDAFLTSDPSVATYVDGVYFPFAYNLGNHFGGVERIEVLKGPQGTLFGRNATGGAIHVITRRPAFEHVTADALLTVGNHGRREWRLYSNVPLSEQLAISLSFFEKRRDSYYGGRSAAAGMPPVQEIARGGRLKLRYQPTDSTGLDFSFWSLDEAGMGSHFACVEQPSTLGRIGGMEPREPGYDNCVHNGFTRTRGQTRVIAAGFDHSAPWFDVSIIASHQEVVGPGLHDYDGSAQPLVELESDNQGLNASQGELLFSSAESAMPLWLQWIAGVNVYEGVGGFFQFSTRLAGLSLYQDEALGLSLPAVVSDAAALLAPDLPTPELEQVGLVGTRALGVFTQLTFTLTRWLDLTLGVRHQREERFIDESSAALLSADGKSTTVLRDSESARHNRTGEEVPGRIRQHSLKPRIALEVRHADMLFYLSYQEAIKGATYNVLTAYQEPSYVEPEEVSAYELGVKGEWFAGHLRLNAAAFHYDIKNLQTQFVSIFEGGIIGFYNAEAARSYGMELDGQLLLLPELLDNVVLSGAIARVNAEYTRFSNGSGYAEEGGAYQSGQDFSGNTMVRSPETTAFLSVSKTWSLGQHELEVAADAYYSSELWFESSNASSSYQRGYSLYGARLAYVYQPWQMRLTLWGRNLTDELYREGGFGSDFGFKPNYGPPRSYGLQLGISF